MWVAQNRSGENFARNSSVWLNSLATNLCFRCPEMSSRVAGLRSKMYGNELFPGHIGCRASGSRSSTARGGWLCGTGIARKAAAIN
jgi:hypothetical protein